jgi:putative acetyltransferase
MNRAFDIRETRPGDRAAIHAVETAAFGQPDEADLVERLVAAGDVVLELVAVDGETIIGHILFSRLMVEDGAGRPAVALAPLAVAPDRQWQGVGMALMAEGHRLLVERGETLSVVLGDPAYYARAGYRHDRAAGFASDYQCDALQALAWGEAPTTGRLVYAPAFSGL